MMAYSRRHKDFADRDHCGSIVTGPGTVNCCSPHGFTVWVRARNRKTSVEAGYGTGRHAAYRPANTRAMDDRSLNPRSPRGRFAAKAEVSLTTTGKTAGAEI